MKIIIITIAMGILSFLSGCNQKSKVEANKADAKTVYPKESFSLIKATFKGKPVIGSINQAYKNYELKSQYPWCVKISIAFDLKNVYDNGLPNLEESAIAYKMEDNFLGQLRKLTTAHYVGHLINDTFMDIYFYVDDPEKVNSYLKQEVSKPGVIRDCRYITEKDPSWKSVQNFFQ